MNTGARVNIKNVGAAERSLKFTVDGRDVMALWEAIKQVREAFPELKRKVSSGRPAYVVELEDHERKYTRDGRTIRHNFHYYGRWLELEAPKG
jgi:hypothetical protein